MADSVLSKCTRVQRRFATRQGGDALQLRRHHFIPQALHVLTDLSDES
jgi:hypothetical protein